MKAHQVIYCHGANGSGKSTLARYLIMCAGGISRMEQLEDLGIVTYTHAGAKLALIGPYRTATGGADSVQPYAAVPEMIRMLITSGYSVFCEGLMTPGVETCKKINLECLRQKVHCTFMLLDVPIEQCTKHVQIRRDRKGNVKPYDNSHLIKKHRSASNWIENLRAARLNVFRNDWRRCRDFAKRNFEIDASGATRVLDI